MSDLAKRAAFVKMLILDVDGVLTDGRLYYSDDGAELKGFSTQDGAALKMLMGTGVEVAIITGRRSELVARRARELGIVHYYPGADDKAEAKRLGARGKELAFKKFDRRPIAKRLAQILGEAVEAHRARRS